MLVNWLLVQWHRVMYGRRNASILEFLLIGIAIIDHDRVLGVDRRSVGSRNHARDALLVQQFSVSSTDFLALLNLPVETL